MRETPFHISHQLRERKVQPKLFYFLRENGVSACESNNRAFTCFVFFCYGKEEKPQSPLFAMVSATTVSRIRQCRRRLFRNRPPANPPRSLGGSFLRSAGKGGCSNAVIAIFPASVGGGRGAAKTAAATLEQKSFLPPPLFLLPMCICKSQSLFGSAHKSKFFLLLSVRSFCPAAAAATQNIRIWRRRSFPKKRGRSPMPFLSFFFLSSPVK